jgi:uncharacterized metal-binding protein
VKKLLIFLCSGAVKVGDKKLSFRIASRLEQVGIGSIGSIQDLSAQHAAPVAAQKNMVFINDCRAACINVLMHGFNKDKYLLFDITSFLNCEEFDVEEYITHQILPAVNQRWGCELLVD